MQSNFTKTRNGQIAISDQKYLESGESALAGFNYSLCKKDDFEISKQFLDRIFQSNDLSCKVLAIALIFNVRDIENGKGLRLPFTQSLRYLQKRGYHQLVIELIPLIPGFGYHKDLCTLYDKMKKNSETNLKKQLIVKKIVEVYGENLLQEEKEENVNKLGNCAKFAPRERKKYHNFAVEVSNYLFPSSKVPLKDYRLMVTKILSKYLQITEKLMSQQNWDLIDPKYVPSICFQRFKNVFLNLKNLKDEKRVILQNRYEQHIKNAVEGKDGAKINAKRLFINTIVQQMLKISLIRFRKVKKEDEDEDEDENEKENEVKEIEIQALNAQMKDIVEDVKKSGSFLKKMLAVCDVSGSMNGTPMYACIGLGIIINEINQLENYQQNLITFDNNPQFIDVDKNDSYIDRVMKLSQAPWGCSTDFFKTMKLVAEQAGTAEGLPDAIFVFSDMQFDQAKSEYERETKWNTTYQVIEKIFTEQNLPKESIPLIIFWNLRSSSADNNFVVDSNQKGVICISGFSQNLMKSILKCQSIEELKQMDPLQFLIENLKSKRYEKVRDIAERFFEQHEEYIKSDISCSVSSYSSSRISSLSRSRSRSKSRNRNKSRSISRN